MTLRRIAVHPVILPLPTVSVTPRRQDGVMTKQLSLITPNRSWRLDPHTRRRGLDGIAAARAVLIESRIRAREAALAEGESLELHVADAA
jgi:hypothetical protein